MVSSRTSYACTIAFAQSTHCSMPYGQKGKSDMPSKSSDESLSDKIIQEQKRQELEATARKLKEAQ